MRRRPSSAIALALMLFLGAAPGRGALSAEPPEAAASASSAQLFEQMFVVFEHPRCMNCHTGEAFPRQGDDGHRHTMNVMRGPADRGAPGLHCSTCHSSANQAASGVPGASDWHLAPTRMTWTGLGAGQLCRALRDPALGAMPPGQMLDHFATGLVRWGWAPGTNAQGLARATPPLSYAEFIALTKRWVASGAACPQ